MSRCPYCMSQLKQEQCPRCGYPEIDIPIFRGTLPPGTVLMERYQVGAALETSFQGIAYAGLDLQSSQNVLITEFFPKKVASRQGAAVVVGRNAELFPEARRLYLSETKNRDLPCMDRFMENNTAYRVYALEDPLMGREMASHILDVPVLFRDERGNARMSVNTLTIPPFPKQSKWQLAPGIARYQRSRRNRTVLISLLSAVLIGGGAFLTYEMLTPKAVRLTVSDLSGSGVRYVKVNDDHYTPAPGSTDSTWTLDLLLKRGKYNIEAGSNSDMTTELTNFEVIGKATPHLAIPTPTASPIPYATAAEHQWLEVSSMGYFLRGEGGRQIEHPEEADQIARSPVTINNIQLPEDWAMVYRLKGSTFHEQLNPVDEKVEMALSDGEYELLLHDLTSKDEPVYLTGFTVKGKQTNVRLMADALMAYANVFSGLEDGQHLMCAGDKFNMPGLDGTSPETINIWAEEYPEQFAKYQMEEYTVHLDEDLNQASDRTKITIGDLTLPISDGKVTLWANEAASTEQLTVDVRVNNGKLESQTLILADLKDSTTTLSSRDVTAIANLAGRVIGRVLHGNQEYLLTKDSFLTEEEAANYNHARQEYSYLPEFRNVDLTGDEFQVRMADGIERDAISSIKIAFGNAELELDVDELVSSGMTFTAPAVDCAVTVTFTEAQALPLTGTPEGIFLFNEAKDTYKFTFKPSAKDVTLLEQEAASVTAYLAQRRENMMGMYKMATGEVGVYVSGLNEYNQQALVAKKLTALPLFTSYQALENEMTPVCFQLDERLLDGLLDRYESYENEITLIHSELGYVYTMQDALNITHLTNPLGFTVQRRVRLGIIKNEDLEWKPNDDGSYTITLMSCLANETIANNLHFWGKSDKKFTLDNLQYFEAYEANQKYFDTNTDQFLEKAMVTAPAPDQYKNTIVSALVLTNFQANEEDVYELEYQNPSTGAKAKLELTPGEAKEYETIVTPTPEPTPTPTPTMQNPYSPPYKDPNNSETTSGHPTVSASTPAATPTDTSSDTPVETPTDTSSDTPVETPTDTSSDTPVETPTGTSSDTPVETPTGNLAQGLASHTITRGTLLSSLSGEVNTPAPAGVVIPKGICDLTFYFLAPEGTYTFRVTTGNLVRECTVIVEANGFVNSIDATQLKPVSSTTIPDFLY